VNDVDAIKEVGAKALLLDVGLQVTIAGAPQANIEGPFRLAGGVVPPQPFSEVRAGREIAAQVSA
jgi:hypothetical protein